LFAKDFDHHKKQAEKGPGYDKANEQGRGALIDLAFNMGGAWFKKFPKAAAALLKGDFKTAAAEMVDSQWYKQVKGRAKTIVAMIENGIGGGPSKAGPAGVDTKPIASAGSTFTTSSAPSAGAVPSLSSLVKLEKDVDISGLNPEFSKRVAVMAAAFLQQTGKKLLITSGFRSNEKQKELYDAWIAGKLKAPIVSKPYPPLGTGKKSSHMVGLAIDINTQGPEGINVLAGSREKPTGWLEKFGLVRNVPGEDWHISSSGSPPTPDNPANPGQSIPVPGKDGKPVDVATGEPEVISPTPSTQGSAISSASSQVASGQRQQAKPTIPVVVNAPTTNNQVVKKTEIASAGNPNQAPTPSTAQRLAARATV